MAKRRIKFPSQAVLDARARRIDVNETRKIRIEWYIKNVSDKLEMTLKQRVKLAAEFLRNKVVRNISQSVEVRQQAGPRGGFLYKERSEPGEFPRADTTHLMKSIASGVMEVANGEWEGRVGTHLDYGVILEVSEELDRSFLQRTLREEQATITRILTGPIKLK